MKPSYKQTEVGVIPEEWEVVKLGEISRVIRGASPRPKGDRRFYGGQIPRLMVEDVTRDGKTVFPQVDSLTEEGAKRSRPCKKGTLTIVCSGTVGIPSFLGVDACIHDGFLALVSIRKNVSSDYLYYQFDRLRLTFESSATHGGIFTNLTTAGVREFSVPLPPTEAEQRAIAEALSNADALLEALDRLIAKKSDLKQAAMQQLLTSQTRLPGFHGEWEVKTF
jgi:type I restriction enzyme S subunit